MENFKIKVGDLVRLRNDLIDGKKYDDIYFYDFMEFNEFEIIEKMLDDDIVIINGYQYTKEMIAEVKRPTKYETIYKREEPILDDKEKEYLGNVIKPFKCKIAYITKKDNTVGEFIHIQLKNGDWTYLPNFKEDTMYKNMELAKKYTLEELGL